MKQGKGVGNDVAGSKMVGKLGGQGRSWALVLGALEGEHFPTGAESEHKASVVGLGLASGRIKDSRAQAEQQMPAQLCASAQQGTAFTCGI